MLSATAIVHVPRNRTIVSPLHGLFAFFSSQGYLIPKTSRENTSRHFSCRHPGCNKGCMFWIPLCKPQLQRSLLPDVFCRYGLSSVFWCVCSRVHLIRCSDNRDVAKRLCDYLNKTNWRLQGEAIKVLLTGDSTYPIRDHKLFSEIRCEVCPRQLLRFQQHISYEEVLV